MSDFEPFSEEYIHSLSPYMASIANIENLIFDFTAEEIPIILEEISKVDENTQQTFYHLILYVSLVRKKQIKNLFLLWNQMKKSQITFLLNDFTFYLRNKGAQINLPTTIMNYKPIYENLEEIFKPNSIEFAIFHDDIDKIIYASIDDIFTSVSHETEFDNVSFINLAAYFGSSKTFYYMQLNGSEFDLRTPEFAIKGGNEEIVEICSKNGCFFNDTLIFCIEYHRNNFLGWLLENYYDIEANLPMLDLNLFFQYHNTLAFCYFTKNYPSQLLQQLSIETIVSSGNLELIHELKQNTPKIDRIAISFIVSYGYLYVLKEFESSLQTKATISFLMNAATLTSQTDIIKYAVEKHANINIVDENGYTPLMRLAFLGNLPDIQFLVDNGANINYVPNKGMTALCCACLSNKIECVQYLIDKGAFVCTDLESQEHLPIFSATIADNPEIIDLLVQKGAQINAHASNGRLPIHTASRYGKINAMKYLVEHGADINNNWVLMGQTPLLFAVANNYFECAEYLLSKGALVDSPDKNNRTPLMYALCISNNELVEILLKYGANVNAIGSDRSPPIFAALHDNYDGLKLLIDHHCDLNYLSHRGETALILSVIRGKIEITRLLLNNGADPDIKTHNGNTALLIAKTEETIKALVMGGANPNVQDKKGLTPLINAIKSSNDNLVEFLLDNNADPNLADIKQNTPLLYAISANNNVSILLLLQRGANPNIENADHISPIKLCINQQNLNTIQLLCQYGATVDESCIEKAKANNFDAALSFFESLKE